LAVEAEEEDGRLVAGNGTRRGDGVDAIVGTLDDCFRSRSLPNLRSWFDVNSGLVVRPWVGGSVGAAVAGVGLTESSAWISNLRSQTSGSESD